MEKIWRSSRRAAFVSPFVLFCLLTLALAPKGESDSNQQPIKTSTRLVTISLTTADNRVILASQHEGEMITTGPDEGDKLGITPHILNNGSVVLEFFCVTRFMKKNGVVGGTTVGVGSLELDSTLPQAIPVNLNSRIQLSSIQLIDQLKATEDSDVRIFRAEPCPCCVSCGGFQTCGAGVILSCGNCSCD